MIYSWGEGHTFGEKWSLFVDKWSIFVDKGANMKVDKLAYMKVDMEVDLVVGKVASMKVDKVANMDFSIIFWAFLCDFFCISQLLFWWNILNFSVKCFVFLGESFWISLWHFLVKFFVFCPGSEIRGLGSGSGQAD